MTNGYQPTLIADDEETLSREHDAVRARVAALTAAGSATTTATFEWLTSARVESARKSLAILITDGLSACSTKDMPDPATCACTANLAAGTRCTVAGFNMCADTSNSAAAVAALAAAGTRTVVIGFGPEAAAPGSPAFDALNTLASAGDAILRCETDAECGPGNRCDRIGQDLCGNIGSACSGALRASNAAELSLAIQRAAELARCLK